MPVRLRYVFLIIALGLALAVGLSGCHHGRGIPRPFISSTLDGLNATANIISITKDGPEILEGLLK